MKVPLENIILNLKLPSLDQFSDEYSLSQGVILTEEVLDTVEYDYNKAILSHLSTKLKPYKVDVHFKPSVRNGLIVTLYVSLTSKNWNKSVELLTKEKPKSSPAATFLDEFYKLDSSLTPQELLKIALS